MKLSFVIPCYNEEDTITNVHSAITDFMKAEMKNVSYEINFINDGSTDNTAFLLKKISSDRHVRVHTHEVNKGLGAALSTGFRNATGDFIVTIDADLTHDLSTIPELLKNMENADIAVGSRYVKGGKMVGVPLSRVMISRFANFMFKFIFWAWDMKDISSGYRCYRTPAVKNIDITARGFPSQLEIIVKSRRHGARIVEIPTTLLMRKKGSSKFRFFRVAKDYGKLVLRLKFIDR